MPLHAVARQKVKGLSLNAISAVDFIIIIIIIERKDLGGVMSKDCKDTLQTLKTVTKREWTLDFALLITDCTFRDLG